MTWQDRTLGAYGALLRLYTARFRANYAEEMRDVFRALLREARGQGRRAFVVFLLREFSTMLMTGINQRVRAASAPDPGLRRARFVTRGASLLLNLFFGWVLFRILLDSEALYPGSGGVWAQAFPFLFALPLANLAMLVAWRWERLGGWLTIAGGVAIMLTSAYSLVVTGRLMQMDTAVMLPALIANGLWLVPHLLFGLLFLSFDRRGNLTPKPSPA
jgi:hypothetical protein